MNVGQLSFDDLKTTTALAEHVTEKVTSSYPSSSIWFESSSIFCARSFALGVYSIVFVTYITFLLLIFYNYSMHM